MYACTVHWTIPPSYRFLLVLVLDASIALQPDALLTALDYPVPEKPMEIRDDILGTTPVRWVDWGAAGISQRRSIDAIAEEQESLQRWLHSPELLGRLSELSAHCRDAQSALLREQMTRWQIAYATFEQPTGIARADHVSFCERELPQWAYGLPLSIRVSTQIVIFDDRDPIQRDWVLDRAKQAERMTVAICTGWRSGDDRDAFWRTHPGVTMSPVATDLFAEFYGVTAYPACIRFTQDTESIEQGLDH
jgi:hypothetical protein